MSFRIKGLLAIMAGVAMLVVASCAEGPTVTAVDNGESGLVLKKGGNGGGGGRPPQLRDVNLHIDTDLLTNALIGDPRSATEDYIGGKCGVEALAGPHFNMYPFYGGMNKKELRNFWGDPDCDYDGDGISDPRWIELDLAAARVHEICEPVDGDFGPCDNPADHSNEVTLGDLMGDRLDPITGDSGRVFHVRVIGFGEPGSLKNGNFGVPYCNYVRFTSANAPGSNDLLVTGTHVETQPSPDNVGECVRWDASWEPGTLTPLVFLLHLDIAYDVLDQEQ